MQKKCLIKRKQSSINSFTCFYAKIKPYIAPGEPAELSK